MIRSFNGPSHADAVALVAHPTYTQRFPTLADVAAAGYEIDGICGADHPWHHVTLTGAEAVLRFGGHIQTGDLTLRMMCSVCLSKGRHRRLSTHLQPIDYKADLPKTTKSKAQWRIDAVTGK